MATNEPRGDTHGLLLGVVRTVGERGIALKLRRKRSGGHRNRTTESTRAVGRKTCTALHLHRPDGRNQVGRVVPIHRVGVGVVHRNAVDRDIQTRSIRTAQAHRRTADADTRLVRSDHRGGEGQHRGHVRTIGVARELLRREVVIRYGCRLRGACSLDFDLLQVVERE